MTAELAQVKLTRRENIAQRLFPIVLRQITGVEWIHGDQSQPAVDIRPLLVDLSGAKQNSWESIGSEGIIMEFLNSNPTTHTAFFALFNAATHETIVQQMSVDGRIVASLHYIPKNFHLKRSHTELQVYEGTSEEPIDYWLD